MLRKTPRLTPRCFWYVSCIMTGMAQFRSIAQVALVGALIAASIIVFVPLMMRFAESSYMYDEVSDIPKTEAALVLGASVRQGKPSPILEERAHAAVRLYLEGKVQKILVTGDNSALSHDEVTPVRKYLIDASIPSQDIFLDHAGFDTYSSMYRARDVFDVDSVTIVTQDFHLPRALFLARTLGITAYGLHARGGGTGMDYMREVPASLKALIDIVSGRIPKYLGETIPLSSDGAATWY